MKQLGLQMYSVHEFLEKNGYEKTFEKVSEMGYTLIEFYGDFISTPKEEMKALLEKYGLQAVSAHIGDELYGNEQKYMDYLSYLGAKTIICPWADMNNEEEFNTAIERLNKTAKILADGGFRFGYHNHSFEFKTEFNGKIIWDTLFTKTDKAVTAQFDTGNAFHGGADIYELIEKYKDRMVTIHLKDATADFESAPAGKGVIDFKKILEITSDVENLIYIYEYEGPDSIVNCKIAADYLLNL